MLHALPLFADFLGEEQVLQREVQEDVLKEVKVSEHFRARWWSHLVGVGDGGEGEW